MEKIHCLIREEDISIRDCLLKLGKAEEDNRTCPQCSYHRSLFPSGSEIIPKQKSISDIKLEIKKPSNLADAYIGGKTILNDVTFQSLSHFMYGRSDTQEQTSEMNTLKRLKLPHLIRKKINNALADFLLAYFVTSRAKLKIRVKKNIERRQAIRRIEKVLHYFDFSDRTKEELQNKLHKFRQIGEEGQTYSPIKELEYYLTGFSAALRWELLRLIKNGPSALEPILSLRDFRQGSLRGSLRGMMEGAKAESILKESFSQKLKEIEVLTTSNMKFKEGSPSKLILKTMQNVIYRLLKEYRNMPKEKAKNQTATIINEYLIKHGFTYLATIDSKDVDNALHSS